MFNPKENYEPRLIRANEEEGPGLVLPKKTGHFLKYWAGEPDNINNYKVFERNMKLLKWRTLRAKVNDKTNPGGISKIEINSKVLGLGPIFIVKPELENVSNSPIFNIEIIVTYDSENL